jgi:hypothetical protein
MARPRFTCTSKNFAWVSSCNRFFHVKKYGRHKPRSRQNAITVCPLRACSETSFRHFVHAFFERLVMPQQCYGPDLFTRWGSFNAHEMSKWVTGINQIHAIWIDVH